MKICMIWGGMGEGSVETSLLCFCLRWGHARIQEFFFLGGGGGGGGGVQARLPENSSDNFFSPQLYRGWPMVISNKTIVFNIFRGGGGGGGGGFYRNPYNLWFSRGVRTPYPPLDPRMGRLCVCTCPSTEPSLIANTTSTRKRRLQWANDQL